MKVWDEAVGEHGATLTCYVQAASDELGTAAVRPAMLVLPGGGYGFCSDREAEPIAVAYLAEGFHAFVLRYSVGPDAPWEHSFADAQAALAWIRAEAAGLGVDPARVAVVGFSAGGHLAASLGTVAAEKPDALVLGYPVTLAEFGPAMGKQIPDTVAAVTDATPPTFVWATYADNLVPIRNATAFLHACAERGVPCAAHVSVTGAHGLSLARPLTANGGAAMVDADAAEWLPASVRFLRTVLGDFPVEGTADGYDAIVRGRRLGADMPLGRLVADERAVAVLERHLGEAAAALRTNPFTETMTLRHLADRAPEVLSAETLARLDADLTALDG